MNPVILIAVYGRMRLVEINLRLLSEQNCQIVCVASLDEDFKALRKMAIPNLQIIPAPNNPLGAKWQSGVDQCRILDADPLIILGSDDFLDQTFIKNACRISKYMDFVCFDRFFIHSPNDGKNYSLRYKNKFPLGSGRVYSKKYLNEKHWIMFDSERNRLLDDFAWDNTKFGDKILFNPEGMNLLAVKGQWEVLNPLDKILQSESIIWDYETEIDKYFNYSTPIHEIFKNL